MASAEKEEFLRQVHAAYRALADVRCHRLGPPGIKGLQEELLEAAGTSHREMMEAVSPGWPHAGGEKSDLGSCQCGRPGVVRLGACGGQSGLVLCEECCWAMERDCRI